MAKVVQRRRGTTSEHSSFIGLAGEITVNTSLKTVVVHDGTTAGGFSLARSDGSNLSTTAGTISGSSLVVNSIGIGQLNVTDGTAGQVLSTDGSANLSFINVGLTSLGISDGTSGQVLSTDGSGTFSFINIGLTSLGISDGTSGQVLSTNGAGVLSFIDVGLTSLGISDGTVGQVLSTDGAGVLSFIDRDGVAAASGISLALAIAVG